MRFVRMLTGCLLLSACGPAPMPISASASDPSNPHAAEGVSPPAARSSPPGAADDAGAPTAFVCPMHPEVTSPGPSRCPKCGMNLVPKK